MSNFAREPIVWRPINPPAEGPNRSFADSFSQAYEEQVTGWGLLSVEKGLEEAEEEYLNDVFRQTGERIDPLFSNGVTGSPFANEAAIGAARYYEGRGELQAELAERTKRIEELQKQYPDIAGYDSIWESVKERAQAAEQRGASFQRRGRDYGSRFGGFLGAVIGSIDPRTDPLNTMTLGLGGAGRTFLTKVGQESAFAGLTESINQFMGVSENRSLLGLSYGTNQAFAQIALTAAGAGVIRGGAEGASVAAQKLTQRRKIATPPEAVPEGRRLSVEQRAAVMDEQSRVQLREQSIYGETPSAQRMFADEMEAHFSSLQEWFPSQTTKAELLATTAIPELPTANVVRAPPDFALGSARNIEELDYIIRRADPQFGREFDRVNAEIEEAEVRITELELQRPPYTRESVASPELTELDARISQLETKMEAARRPQEKGKVRKKIAALQEQREEALERAFLEEPKNVRIDEQMEAEVANLGQAKDRLNALNARRDRFFERRARRQPTARDFVEGMVGRQLSPQSTRRFENVEEIDEIFTSVEKDTIARFELARRQLAEGEAIDVAGTTMTKDTKILTDDGEMSLDDIFKDLAEDDELMQAAVACKVGL